MSRRQICVKICECSSCICMSCLELVRHPEKCSICRSNTEQYLRSLTNRTDHQIEALACILDKKQRIPERRSVYEAPVIPLRQLPRDRERMADFVIEFMQEMNEKMNNWYNDSINTHDMHYIARNMQFYHNMIYSILRVGTHRVIHRNMAIVAGMYHHITQNN